MNKVQDFYIRLMSVLADIFFSAFVFCLFESRVKILSWNFTPWIIYVIAVFFIDYIISHRDIHTNIYFAFNTIAVVILSFWAQRYFQIDDPRALSTRILYAVAISFPIVHGAVVAFKRIDRHKMLLYFDALVLLEIIFVGLGEGTVFPMSGTFRTLGMICVAGYLSALMLNRLQDEKLSRKKVIGQSLMISFVAFLSAIAFIASNAFETASQGLINGGKTVVLFIFNLFVKLINLILKWLSSLINTVIVAEVPEIKIKEFGIDKSIYDGVWVIPIFVTVVIGCIIGVYIRLRGKRIKGDKRKKNRGKIIRESQLIRGVSKLFRRIAGNITFFFSYIRDYNRVSGLMTWTELHYKKKLFFREKGESQPEFLARVAERAHNERAEELVNMLSEYVEKHYFSTETIVLPEGFSKEYRKVVRHAH